MGKRKKSSNKTNNTKKVAVLIFAIVLLLISGAISYMYFTVQKFDNLMLPGVKIQHIDLSKKSKDESKKILHEKYSKAILTKNINLKCQDRNYSISYSKLNPKYNIDETVEEAINYCNNLNMIAKYKFIKKPKVHEFDLKFSYDGKLIDNTIKNIAEDTNRKPVNAKLSISGGNFEVIPDKKGYEVDNDKLKKEILSKISGDVDEDLTINVPIKEKGAKVTAKALKEVNTELASYSTSYATSSEARSNNIDVATRSLNGTVVMPGQTFSFNDIVGERTKDRGYKEAPVIVNQKLESGLGGGICQVSSTLYNALLKANLKITERVHHTFPSSYVPKGLDATVDWENIDLKFKNTFEYPIYIEGYTSGRQIFFSVYSNKSLSKQRCEISTELYSTIEPKTQYIDDPNLPAGQVESVKSPHTGYRVKTYRNIYQDGKLLKKELISNDYYVPVNGVIKKGTKQ